MFYILVNTKLKSTFPVKPLREGLIRPPKKLSTIKVHSLCIKTPLRVKARIYIYTYTTYAEDVSGLNRIHAATHIHIFVVTAPPEGYMVLHRI